MHEVRLRPRKLRIGRVREIQGMLAMQGLAAEAEQEESESASTYLMEHTSRSRATKSSPGEPRRGRAADVKPLPYRMVLADWPDEWRERWGRRANDLEDAGLSWRDAEGRAFVEVWSQLRAATTGVERN